MSNTSALFVKKNFTGNPNKTRNETSVSLICQYYMSLEFETLFQNTLYNNNWMMEIQNQPIPRFSKIKNAMLCLSFGPHCIHFTTTFPGMFLPIFSEFYYGLWPPCIILHMRSPAVINFAFELCAKPCKPMAMCHSMLIKVWMKRDRLKCGTVLNPRHSVRFCAAV